MCFQVEFRRPNLPIGDHFLKSSHKVVCKFNVHTKIAFCESKYMSELTGVVDTSLYS